MLFEEIVKDAESVPQTVRYKIKCGLATLADQEEALKDPASAYWFARNIPDADIEKCQEVVCKDPEWAYFFAKDIEGADIEKCQEAACKYPVWAYVFARNVKGADVEKCRKACEGTGYGF